MCIFWILLLCNLCESTVCVCVCSARVSCESFTVKLYFFIEKCVCSVEWQKLEMCIKPRRGGEQFKQTKEERDNNITIYKAFWNYRGFSYPKKVCLLGVIISFYLGINFYSDNWS